MKIAVIGCGVIGAMFARHLGKSHELILCDPSKEKREALAKELSGMSTDDPAEAVREAEIVLLAVKPDALANVAKKVEKESLSEQKWISVLAGVSLSDLYTAIEQVEWIRAMPNVTMRVGEGILGIVECEGLDRSLIQRLFSEMGTISFFPESQIDGFTALVGSGPAFVLVFIESLIEGGVAAGLSARDAKEYALGILRGTEALVSQSGQHPEELKLEITSAGGTTIAGLRELENYGMRSSVIEAIQAAYLRSKELGNLKEE